MSVLKNVRVRWASIQTPNTKFVPQWEVEAILTKEQATALLAEAKTVNPKGISIKKDEDGTLFYRFKRKVLRSDGVTENNPPVVVDIKGNPFKAKIGNDSICNIQYIFAPYANTFGKGVVADLKAVQVIQHIAFGGNDGDEFEFEEEATTPSKSSKSKDDYDDDDDFI